MPIIFNLLAQIKGDIPAYLHTIFPELVRYSALRDKMGITLLKALYVNIGEDYANFSIGNFQIKPSFASLVCESEIAAKLKRKGYKIPDKREYKNSRDYRYNIVKSLENTRTEFYYIVIFMKICLMKFDLSQMTEKERIEFLASAYNYGFNHTIDEIREVSKKRYYSTKLISTEDYSYSDISTYWFDHQQ